MSYGSFMELSEQTKTASTQPGIICFPVIMLNKLNISSQIFGCNKTRKGESGSGLVLLITGFLAVTDRWNWWEGYVEPGHWKMNAFKLCLLYPFILKLRYLRTSFTPGLPEMTRGRLREGIYSPFKYRILNIIRNKLLTNFV